jgi:uncharacterized phage-associated protein
MKSEGIRGGITVSTPYDIKALANLFLDWADQEGITVTPMKLQKLLYFCHSDYLSITKSPLIRQVFEAWDFGPVEPSIYEEFKASSKTPIKTRASQFVPAMGRRVTARVTLPSEDHLLVRRLFDIYKVASATALSDLSHEVGGAWSIARRLFEQGRNPDRRMSAKLIMRYHQQRPHC